MFRKFCLPSPIVEGGSERRTRMKRYRSSIGGCLAFIGLFVLGLTSQGFSENGGSPGSSAYHNAKGMDYFKKGFYEFTPAGKDRDAEENYELAAAELKKAIEINPNSAEAHANLARVQYVRKNYAEAAGEYRRVLEIRPNDIDTHVMLALTYTRMERLEDAVDQLMIAKTRTGDEKILQKLDGYIAKIQNRK